MTTRAYNDILSEAIEDISLNGYDTPDRIAYWTERLRIAAEEQARKPDEMERMLQEAMRAIYTRLVEKGKALQYHQGIARFTLEKVRPELRGELDRRILAAADLIRLNRTEAIRNTLHRFQGWATSIPRGGLADVDRGKVKSDLKKPMQRLPYSERFVLTDQAHKLRASISEVLAQDGGALGGIWHSNWRQSGYQARITHKERDLNFYTMRDNWAIRAGLMKVGPYGYYDDITPVAFEPNCRCFMQWRYSLRAIPPEQLTVKGRAELDRVRVAA